MKKAIVVLVVIALLGIAAVSCLSAPPAGPQIVISGAWGRPSPMKAGNGAAYMVIENAGSDDDRLVSAASDVSEVVELHDMKMEGDVMKMFHVDGIDIPAGESVELKPGGKHVMFIGLHEKLEIGQTVSITLEFENFGELIVEAEIREE